MFKQKSDIPPAQAPADPVQQARTRARQRLIGAIVLLVIGIIGFPLVFETQPRPIPVDIPIEIPKKDALPPLAAPPATPPSSTAPIAAALPASRPRPAARPAEPKPAEEMITESRSEAGREVAPRAAPHGASAATAPPGRSVAAASAPPKASASAPAPVRAAEDAARPAGDGERARALLEGRSAASAEAQRFVVQVGAFADAEAARETRLKVEKLGLRTYTQIAQTPSGSRIRVRVGPFGSRAEADAALDKAKAAGLTAVVLTL